MKVTDVGTRITLDQDIGINEVAVGHRRIRGRDRVRRLPEGSESGVPGTAPLPCNAALPNRAFPVRLSPSILETLVLSGRLHAGPAGGFLVQCDGEVLHGTTLVLHKNRVKFGVGLGGKSFQILAGGFKATVLGFRFRVSCFWAQQATAQAPD